MPLIGEYEPSAWAGARDQVELFEKSHGSEGNTLSGLPVVIITTTGKSTGKLRKTPVMRVEHQGRYAAIASMGGAPTHPGWYHNLKASPLVGLQDGAVRKDYTARELEGKSGRRGGRVPSTPSLATPTTRSRRPARSPSCCSIRCCEANRASPDPVQGRHSRPS